MSEYRLVPMQANLIYDHLSEQEINNIESINIFPSLTSTNDYFKQREFKSRNEIAICISEEQTQGRGRIGHQWVSPSGVNLYLSAFWPLLVWGKQYETLSLRLLIAVAELIEELGFENVQLKWPNDICIQNKKLGGILIERISSESKDKLVIGIGINIAMSKHNNLQLDAPWIDLITINPDWTMSRNEFAARVISSLHQCMTSFEKNSTNSLASLWKRYDLLNSQNIEFTYQEKRCKGMAHGIDDAGQLVVEINSNVLHLHSAHVSEITL